MPWGDFISDCVPGQPVSSARHNTIRDQVAHIVTTMAQLPTDAADGSYAIVGDRENRAHIRRGGRWWSTRAATLAKTTDANGVVVLTAAELGFVTLTWGVGHVRSTPGPATVAWSGTEFLSNTVTVRTFFYTPATGLVGRPSSLAVSLYTYAEGYVT